ncbi:MAG: glycerol-3-phosphate acyltransferase, partial [Lachnospiraceae bacterium]|nr:glycerol-3-phosphate acyltransferase [Lachnospiraceae bacterium]
VILFFGAFFITHYVSLGSLLVYAGFLIETVILGQMGVFGMTQALLNEMYAILALLTAMAYWKHRENIKRLLSGTERKTYLTHKNKEPDNTEPENKEA